MQAQTFSRKKIIGILVILGLLLAMYFALKLARQAQDIRKRAAGTGDVLLTLNPTAKSAAKGEAFNVKIVMKNNATSPKTISTAGVDLDFDPALFTVSAISCGSNFPSAAVSRVDTAAKKIYLTCFVGAGSPAYSMAAGSQADLGSFTLTVGSSVPTTSTDLSFTRTNIADSVTFADLSNPGTKATYNVGDTPNLTVTPTLTPTLFPQTSTTISDNFDGASLDTSKWNTWKTPVDSTTVVTNQENGVFRVRIPTGQTTYSDGVIEWKQEIQRDFEVVADLRIEQSDIKNASDTLVAFHDMQDGWKEQFIFALRRRRDSISLFANIKSNDIWGTEFSTVLGGNSAKVKMQRIGNIANFFYDVGSGYVLLGSMSNVFGGNGRLFLLTNTWEEFPAVTSSFDNFSAQINPVETPTPTPTPTGPTLTPSPTPSPTGVVSETPTPTLTPSITPTGTLVPTVTSTPTPPSGQEAYTIDIGTKAVLGINIGAGNTPQIKFTAKLAGAESHPDMYFKLRAKDDLAFVDNPNSGPTCESPGAGGVDLYVPMKADNSGIYSPVTGINISAPAGAVVAPVSSDGWVSLTGLSAGKYYTLNLKGAKTRGTDMLKHVLLAGGQSASQNYDWTDNGLQPGDLPDPNNSNKQDCTVNSVDISLINSRLGRTDSESLNIADVSYDGVVNANDIAQVVGTLSTKPDDDN